MTIDPKFYICPFCHSSLNHTTGQCLGCKYRASTLLPDTTLVQIAQVCVIDPACRKLTLLDGEENIERDIIVELSKRGLIKEWRPEEHIQYVGMTEKGQDEVRLIIERQERDYNHNTHVITTPEEEGLSEEDRYIKDILKKPYSRIFVYDEESDSYAASILEFSGCLNEGATVAEAATNLDRSAEGWLKAVIDKGQHIPEPMEHLHQRSGSILLRVPKYIHDKAVRYATLEGVSLNQFISSALSVQIGKKLQEG